MAQPAEGHFNDKSNTPTRQKETFGRGSDMKRMTHTFLFLVLVASVLSACNSTPSAAKTNAWSSLDIGDVALAGSFTSSADSMTLKASGKEIAAFEDSFHFVYKSLKGNGSIISQINSIEDSSPWASAGIMIRSSLTTDASHAMLALTSKNGAWFTWRSENEIESESLVATQDKNAQWLKLERAGDVFKVATSLDGQTWQEHAQQEIPMNEQVYIGFASTSNDAERLSQSQFAGLKLTGLIEQAQSAHKEIESEAISLPIVLRGQTPNSSTINLEIDKSNSASRASIIISAFDPDHTNEGELYINDNGPIKLFGNTAHGGLDSRVEEFSFDTPVSWWKDGSNKLRFSHIRTGGYRIEEIKVAFDGNVNEAKGSLESFPISLQRSAPESTEVQVTLSKANNASSAIIDFNVYDADHSNEGQLFINGNGPVQLFGNAARGANDSRSVDIRYITPASWWKEGSNTLRFVHTRTGGYRINRASVSFDSAAAEPNPEPTPDPQPDPEPVPTPSPTDLLPSAPIPPAPSSATYYVATNGSNSNNGRSTGNPFKSIGRAISVAQAGDVVFVRGGKYYNEEIRFTRSGTASKPITVMSYPGEWAVIDWSNKRANSDSQRVWFDGADHIVMRNMEIFRGPAQCVFLRDGADHNIFVNMVFNSCFGSGFQIYEGSYNIVAYSVAKNNYGNDDSDGFGSIGQGGFSTQNQFWYNIADHNADDGFDTWKSTKTYLFGNISRDNGYNGGDGNGFKLGSSGMNVQNTARRNISYNNKRSGFDNNIGGGNLVENNTAWGNGRHNFESSAAVATNTWRNNLSSNGSVGMFDDTNQKNNSWNLGINNPNFKSTNPNSSDFLALNSGSPAIDKGTNVELAYKGSAPDLGALELGMVIAQLYSN